MDMQGRVVYGRNGACCTMGKISRQGKDGWEGSMKIGNWACKSMLGAAASSALCVPFCHSTADRYGVQTISPLCHRGCH